MNIDNYEETLRIINIGRSKEDYINDYINFINEIKNKRTLDKNSVNFYSEIHHIIPRCKGGSDDDDNLVLLSMKEHILAHILLSEAFPEFPELAAAAKMMINRGSNNNSLVDIISKEGSSILNYINTISVKKYEIPVVCFDDDFLVIRVYHSLTEASYDGFSVQHISSVLSKNRKTTGGYNWMKLKDFKVSNEKNLNKYYDDLDLGIIQKIVIPDNRVICCNDKLDIIKIFNRVSEVESYGLDSRQVSAVLVGKQKTSRGLFWFRYQEFEKNHKDKLENYSENPKININDYVKYNKPSTLSEEKVIKFDDINNRIDKIYYNRKDLENDGYYYPAVLRVAYGKRNHYSGYTWILYDTFLKEKSSDVIKDYEKSIKNYII